MKRIISLAAFALLLAACGGRNVLSAPPADLDLNGNWKLNEQDSERPTQQLSRPGDDEEAMPPEGGMPPSPGRRPARAAGAGAIGPATRPLPAFALEQSDSAVVFRFGMKRSAVVPADGRKVKVHWPELEEIDVSARWATDGLRVERTLAEGAVKVSETYYRAPGSDRLVVTTRIKGRMPGMVTMKSAYDLVKP